MSAPRSRYWTMVGRALRLRCPRCGGGLLFSGWFRMRPRCDWCGLVYEREPGFFLGSVYINYGLTAVLITVSYLTLFFNDAGDARGVFIALAMFCFLFPLWFFRYARSLWLAFDQYWDPREDDEQEPEREE